MLIPTYRDLPDVSFDARNVSYIAIQVKNKTRADTATRHTDFAVGIEPFSGEEAIPHIPLLVWLDLQAPERELDIRPKPLPKDVTKTTRSNPKPGRYNLYVSGHASRVYGPLQKISDGEGEPPTRHMAALIGSMQGYGATERDLSNLDQDRVQANRASCQGQVHAAD